MGVVLLVAVASSESEVADKAGRRLGGRAAKTLARFRRRSCHLFGEGSGRIGERSEQTGDAGTGIWSSIFNRICERQEQIASIQREIS